MQVQLTSATEAQHVALEHRFHRFYSRDVLRVEYPVTCDSHGLDVFRDEFAETTMDVDCGWLISLPFPSDHFVPFTDDDSGTVVAALTCEICGSKTDKHFDEDCFK